MNITIRKRSLKNKGTYALYLDFYANGKQWQENLKLYLENDKNDPNSKQRNKSTMLIAEKIKTEKLWHLQNDTFGYRQPIITAANFNEYFYGIVTEKQKNGVDSQGWDSAYKQFNKFRKNVPFSHVTESLLEEYKSHLERTLKQNTAQSYFSKVKATVNKGYRDNLFRENPAEKVKLPKQVDTNREYLTMEEVNKLKDTDCRYDILKRAFLFSCMTGLRWSDINKLTWQEIRNIEGKYHIVYTQKKTKNAEILPISESAYMLLGEPGEWEEKVFLGLKYSAYMNVALVKWTADAGIKKHITFHCGRHTNAVLLLNNGVDIYTVSNMLGHRELKTTQIYAKVINKTKVAAMEKLPVLSFA